MYAIFLVTRAALLQVLGGRRCGARSQPVFVRSQTYLVPRGLTAASVRMQKAAHRRPSRRYGVPQGRRRPCSIATERVFAKTYFGTYFGNLWRQHKSSFAFPFKFCVC
ncbi:hypothetical protein DFH08DRAFT_435676 [Mycena albidolilacea]|uniref:Secreted protein n=1 Tax=Mycena albidolilacea TaxID=1033008 RepID=A0AAD7EDY7_9AGAR|nr:hypothetical protein DFH08DRAFT_435676 [Mycena albidolilacea]